MKAKEPTAKARIRTRTVGPGMPRCLRADALDDDAEAFLRLFNLLVPRSVTSFEITGLRRRWRLMATALGEGAPVAATRPLVVAGAAGPIEAKLIVPEGGGEPRPALLWCPGGGFLMGDADCAHAMCRTLASASGCSVVVVPYRLAPEHDLYAGRDDVSTVVEWIAAHGAAIGIDARRLAVGGDSAGGNIAAAVAQRCARGEGPALRLQVLCYPGTNLSDDYPSKTENARGYLLTADSIDWIKSQISGKADLSDPWLSPALGNELAGVAPAIIVSAGFDPIRDEGLDYAARLRNAGVPVELLHYPGQFHGFLNFDALVGTAADALRRVGTSLGDGLHRDALRDHTIETAQAKPVAQTPLNKVSSQMLRSTSMVWSGGLRWADAVLHALSPSAALVTRLSWLPWAAPAALLRDSVTKRLGSLSSCRTYDARRLPEQPRTR